jgi:hypothetical protein
LGASKRLRRLSMACWARLGRAVLWASTIGCCNRYAVQ